MGVSIVAWAFSPTVPLIMLAYVALAVGTTFLSGAEDALFFESVQITGRTEEYSPSRRAGQCGHARRNRVGQRG